MNDLCVAGVKFVRLLLVTCFLTVLVESILFYLSETDSVIGGALHVPAQRLFRSTNRTVTSSPTIEKEHVQEKRNWTYLHLVEKEKTIQELHVLQRRLGSQFVTLEDGEPILSFEELKAQFESLLQDRSIIITGDSTARIIFVALWCLLDGVFSSDGSKSTCDNRMNEAKARCLNSTTDSDSCHLSPTFKNASFTGSLFYDSNMNLGVKTGLPYYIAKAGENATIVALPPCLHSLWAPGAQEHRVHTQYHTWNTSFQTYYDEIYYNLMPRNSLLFLTPVAVCDAKLFQKPLIDMYLEEKEFLNGGPREAVAFFTRGTEYALPSANYSGPIPIVKAFRANHSCDNALFDDGGALRCTAVGFEVLLKHNIMKHPGMKVLDIRKATENGCDGTGEGFHYTSSPIQQRELTLLVKGMKSQLMLNSQVSRP